MQLTFTDFQKDCLVKAKDHLNKIPRHENNIIRWNLMPGKVALIVDFWKQSKLSAEAFADALMITKSLLPKFARGRTSSNEKWPELLALLKPEEAEKNKVKKEKQKSEKVVEDAIFKILLRDQVKEIGLRTETIVAEISSYPSRFVSTVLNRLERAGRLVKFKGEDKYTKWKVVEHKGLKQCPNCQKYVNVLTIICSCEYNFDTKKFPISLENLKSIDSVIPEVKIVEEPKIEKIELPGKEYGFAQRMSFRNSGLEDLDSVTKEYVTIKVPISLTCWKDCPLEDWSEVLYSVRDISPNLIPDFKEFFKTGTYLDMLKALEQAKIRMKLNSYQEVIDRLELIIKSIGV